MRCRNLGKANFARNVSHFLFVLREAITVHKYNCNSPKTAVIRGFQRNSSFGFIKRFNHIAMRADALINFHNLAVQQFGQRNFHIKNARAVLVGDSQLITKTFGDCQQRFLTLTFKQGIGGHRGAHFYRFNRFNRNSIA